jgi:hypothetical protein
MAAEFRANTIHLFNPAVKLGNYRLAVYSGVLSTQYEPVYYYYYSSLSPLGEEFTIMYLKHTTFLWYTVLQLFCIDRLGYM